MYYSGIDLHKNNCYITTINKDGTIIKQSKLPNDEHVILDYFFSIGNIHKAVVESTSNWYWLSDLLKNHQIDLTLAHAKYLKAISYAKVKTDKVDSQTPVQLLRMNLIPTAHQISSNLRGGRDAMRARLRLVQKKTSSILSIHRILEKLNISIPENRQLQFISTLPYLKDLPLSDEYQFQVDCFSDQIRLLHNQIKALEKSLHPQLIPNDDIQRLLWIPGIGKISAFTIYLEVDGINRFPDVKKFFSYCRLVPGASNSNNSYKHKSGSKDGNRYLKVAFTEVAVRAVQYYKEIKQFYQRKSRKTNNPIAKTIVAKELARITYHVLKDQTEFKTFKGITLSKEKTMQWPRLSSPDA
jgi:transposase